MKHRRTRWRTWSLISRTRAYRALVAAWEWVKYG